MGQFDHSIEYLCRYIDVFRVIVFGSFFGTRNQESDIDILIVSDDFENIFTFKRIELVKKCFAYNYIDPVCLTKGEYQLALENGTKFSKNVMKYGRVVYERGCSQNFTGNRT